MRTWVRKLGRLTVFGLWMGPFALYAFSRCLGGRGGIRRVSHCTQAWGRFLVRLFGIQVEFSCDHAIPDGVLVVSNHQSYLDILIHASLFPIRFTPKAEIRRWPVLGWYLGISRPIWIDRKSRQQSARLLPEFRRTLGDGVSLLVYPEGTTTDGRHGLLPLKSAPFETVVETAYPIQPIITCYLEEPDHWNPAWYGDQTLLPHVWRFAGRPVTRVRVTALPLVYARPGEDRKTLAARVETQMTEAMNRTKK